MSKKGEKTNKALLVVSFGTTHEDTRRACIDAIEEDLAKAFPDRKLYRGWTSRMIVRRLREQGASVDTLEEALARMREDGMTDILVQPTHIMRGAENDRMLETIKEAEDRWGEPGDSEMAVQIRTGQPLLSSAEDLEQLAGILTGGLLESDPGRVLVLMGHGTDKKPEANLIYGRMQETFHALGFENVFIGTVEGRPSLDDVLEQLGRMDVMEGGSRQLILTPLMIVAGDHAKNDMAGDSQESWKSRIEALGLQVVPVLRGLGEYPEVRQMLAAHAQEAEGSEEPDR